MLLAGTSYAAFEDVYFEAARAYAIDKGANYPEHDAAGATIQISGRSYFVVFSRSVQGGTLINIRED